MHRRFFIIVTLLFITGCSMPDTRIYSLYMPTEIKQSGAHGNAVISVQTNATRYLMQPYIAYRKSPYQIDISRYAKWDAAPDVIVRNAFIEHLVASGNFIDVKHSHTPPSGFYALNLFLKHFEQVEHSNGTFAEITIDAELLSPDGKALLHTTVNRKTPLTDVSPVGLARGLSTGLQECMAEIHEGIIRSLSRR